MKRIHRICAAVIAASIVVSVETYAASPEEFTFSASIGKTVPATVIIVGMPDDRAAIGKLVDMVIQHAEAAQRSLADGGTDSDIARLNASVGGGPVEIGWQAAECLSRTRRICAATGMDVLAPNDSSCADIVVDTGARTAELKRPGMHISTARVMDGFLADLMARYIHAAGMNNALVKVGAVYRGIGSSLHGPWRVSVEEDSSTYAKHAMNIVVSDMAVAIAGGTKRTAAADGVKAAAIAMGDAVEAKALAWSVTHMPAAKALDLIKGIAGARGLIIDGRGRFEHVGLNARSP